MFRTYGACIFVWALGCAAASPWGRPEGELLSIQKADFFNAKDDNRSFTQDTTESYVELGLSPKVTIGGKFSWGTQSATNADGTTVQRQGIADAEVFLQRQMARTSRGLITAYGSYLPETSLISPTTGQTSGRDAAAELGVMWGQGGEQRFATGKFGLRRSLGGDADQLKLEASAGRHFGRIMFVGEAFVIQSISQAAEGGAAFDTATLSASSVVRLTERTHAQLGIARDIHTDNTDPGERVFVALWYTK